MLLGLVNSLLEAYLWYLTFFKPIVVGAQLCKQDTPRSAEVTNVTMALIFGWLMEAADRLFLSSFIAIRWAYLIIRIVICLYLQHPKLLGANRVYETAFAGLVDRYGPVVDSLFLQHMQTISEMGLVQYATDIGLTIVRAMSGVVEMAAALITTSTTTSVEPAPLPRRLSQERDDTKEATAAPTRREPLVTVTYEQPEEAKRERVPTSLPPRTPPPPPVLESSDDTEGTTPFATVRPARGREANVGSRAVPAARAFSRHSSRASSEL